MNTNIKAKIFKASQIGPGIQLKIAMSIGGSQPPRKKMAAMPDISSMLAYSPKKNRAKVMAEYSVWYPATNSASASGRSKGARLVSARAEMKKITAIGNNGENRNQRSS